VFNIDTALEEDIKNGLTYNFNDYEKCIGFSKSHHVHLIRGEYFLAESTDKSSKSYYNGMIMLQIIQPHTVRFPFLHFEGVCFPDSAPFEGLDSIMASALEQFGRTFRKHLYQDLNAQLRVADYFAM
jgi:hypothetical protein